MFFLSLHSENAHLLHDWNKTELTSDSDSNDFHDSSPFKLLIALLVQFMSLFSLTIYGYIVIIYNKIIDKGI